LIHEARNGLDSISRLNLPAILELRLPAGGKNRYFLTLVQIGGNHLLFHMDNGEKIETTIEDVAGLWSGLAYVPWINFIDYEGTIPISGAGADVLLLKELLEKIGYDRLVQGTVYDAETKKAVMEIQKKHGIPVDGLVGPLTKIAIYNELPGLDIPHIRNNGAGPQPTEPKVID
jgi:general secretion pathway protein A